MSKLDYTKLGATLFVPASHLQLHAIVNEEKYKDLKSLVIDFEDGLDVKLLDLAMKNLENILKNINQKSPLIFLRARDTNHLKHLLTFPYINNITGFVLAKFSLKNAQEYLTLLQNSTHLLMPSIEGKELFNHTLLHQLKEVIITNKQKVVLVRFGLEDMLKYLGMRRKCSESLFDLSAPCVVIGNLIATFKSAGFAVSGGVYPCFKDVEGFIKDVKRDLQEGLFSKTIIHPSQIALTHELYKVSQKEYDEAVEIVHSKKVLFAQNAKMAEVTTMKKYSQEIVLRANIYGIKV